MPKPITGKIIGYVRVSSKDQENDLITQEKALAIKANALDIKVDTVIKDIGSGLNFKKKGFTLLLDLLFKKQVSMLVLMHKDRLLRFGSELIFKLCNHLGVKVVLLEPSPAVTALEQLSLDLVEIITVFSAKVYGMRSHANKVVLATKIAK